MNRTDDGIIVESDNTKATDAFQRKFRKSLPKPLLHIVLFRCILLQDIAF